MYKIKYMAPWCIVQTEIDEFVCRVNCIENAELIKRLLNYDLIFKQPYFSINKFSKKSKLSFEKLVNNNEL